MTTKGKFMTLAFVIAALLLAACGSVTPSAAPQATEAPAVTEAVVEPTEAPQIAPTEMPAATEPVAATEAAPIEPVVLRFPITSDPSSLEPGLVKELIAGQIALNLHAGLFTYDEDTKVVPYLVTEYEVSDDGTTYIFHLNENAIWHNGRPIVAEDFKQGWMRYLDPLVGAQAGGEPFMRIVGAKELFDGTADDLPGVVALDEHTLQVTLTGPFPTFTQELAVPVTWVVPSEAVVAGQPQWVGDPVGAGPFKFVEWLPNVKVVLEANPDFFLGKPAIDRVEFVVIPDRSTALAQYEAGEIDIVGVPSGDLQRVSEDPVLSQELVYFTRAQLVYAGMNQSMFEPFKDVRVRQAFNYAIDRKTIIENILNNAYLVAEGLVPPNIPQHNPDLKGYTYDPALAQQLMADAGYPSGAGFPPLTLAALASDGTIAEAMAAQLTGNLGISIEVLQPERGDMIDGLWAHDRWEMFYFGWTADAPTAAVWTYELLYSDLDSNFSTYSNPLLDEQVDLAQESIDPEASKLFWQAAETIAIEDAALIPFGYSRHIFLVKPALSGFFANLFGPMGFETIVKK